MTFTLSFILAGCSSYNQGPPSDVSAANAETPDSTSPVDAPTPTTEAPPPDRRVDDGLTAPIRQAILAPDRSPADRELDGQRHPGQMLTFFGIEPSMRVAELAAGGGYTAELLARSVGDKGQVFGQNSPFILNRFAEAPWSERLQKPVMHNVVRVDAEFETPLPPAAINLDAVLIVLFYHDTVWFKTDRAAMNRAIYTALKPGGVYGVIDHSARDGDGVTQAETLHRIEETVVIEEVKAAGFELAATADFLRNPADQRDWNASPRKAGEQRGTSDRFVLKFVKPQR